MCFDGKVHISQNNVLQAGCGKVDNLNWQNALIRQPKMRLYGIGNIAAESALAVFFRYDKRYNPPALHG